MKKLCILFMMFSGLLFAQTHTASLLVDMNVGGGHLNPGIGGLLPVSLNSGIPVKVTKYSGSVALTAGYSYDFYHIKKDSVSAVIDIGGNFGLHNVCFVHEYSVGYNKWISDKWTVSPYIQYGVFGGSGSWSAGVSGSFRFK